MAPKGAREMDWIGASRELQENFKRASRELQESAKRAPHASSLRMPREKKCPADTTNEIEHHDSP